MDQEISDKTYTLISYFCFGESWGFRLKDEVKKEYFEKLFKKLDDEYKNNKSILPERRAIFRPFRATNPEIIKVVMVGDYPVIETSSIQIFKDCIPKMVAPEDLARIFLIDTILTIDCENPNSHRNIGWEQLIEESLNILLNQNQKILFIFIGEYSNNMHSKLKIPDDCKHIFMNINNYENVPKDIINNIESIFLEDNIKLNYIDEQSESVGLSDSNTKDQT
jgi:uracil DNA glycosylase